MVNVAIPVLDIGDKIVDQLVYPSGWYDPPTDQRMITQETEAALRVLFQALPYSIIQALKYHRIGRIQSWSDNIIRESWMDELLHSSQARHGAKKKLLAKVLLRLIPVIGWTLAAYDLYQLIQWIDGQLSSPHTSATGHGRNGKKQIRSTPYKNSRRKHYAYRRKTRNRYT